MGRTSAVAMRASVQEDVALEWHLTSNHYPPLPLSMVAVAKRALAHVRTAHDDEFMYSGCTHRLRLPDNVTYKGKHYAPVVEVMENMHLWDFVE